MSSNFYIFGNLNLIPGQYDTWMKSYHADAEPHVWQNEPETCLSYYFLIPEEQAANPSATPFILAFEGYTQRSDLYDLHLHSDALTKRFLPAISHTMITGLDLTNFEDVAGYMDKITPSGKAKACGVVKVTKLKAYPGKRDVLIERLARLAEYVEREEEEAYTWLVLKGLDDEVSLRVLERYGTKEALVGHEKGKERIECFFGAKDVVASLEAQRFVETGKGWLHR